MGRTPKQEGADIDETQEVTETNPVVTISADELRKLLSGGTMEKKHAVKVYDGDYIGLPNQPLVGKGEGMERFVICLIEISMGDRGSTRPGVPGNEGYPISVKILDIGKVVKGTQVGMDVENRHTGGCVLSQPGQPNHCLWRFKESTVKPDQRINHPQVDAIWKPNIHAGRTVGYNYEMVFKLEETK